MDLYNLGKNNTKGFTLVELSIVLVIIGLLIGGILVAQSMVQTTRVSSQIQQLEQFDIGVANSITTYKCLASDCPYAFRRDWLGNTHTGNNNKVITGHGAAANFMGDEQIYFFPWMSSAGFIKTPYSARNNFGPTGGPAWTDNIGEGRLWPQAAMADQKNKGITITGGATGGIYYFLGLSTGEWMAYFHTLSASGIFSPAQSLALDKKIDDGFASTGNIFASTNRQTVNSSCGALCAAYTDTTPMQIDTTNGQCTNNGSPRVYNTSSTSNTLCRLTVRSSTDTY